MVEHGVICAVIDNVLCFRVVGELTGFLSAPSSLLT